ncbi:MAG: electron transport complex subunit RsxC [Thermodesulfobacteriota bacterium]
MNLKTFDKGVHPAEHKGLTADKAVRRANLPETVIIPLQQHIGPPCQCLVKKGDIVAEGQIIGEGTSFISAPVHSSISGKVKDIDAYPHPSGRKIPSVVIEGDGETASWEALNHKVRLDDIEPDDIREKVRDAGIVGMGGAAFPTSVKLTLPKGKKIDTVILNGCECEPFLTSDYRIMLESPEKVVWGLQALMKAAGANRGIIGIEENKLEAVKVLREAVTGAPGLEVMVLETKYPQGAEKMLIQAAIDKKVPLGALPLEVGVLVNNVGTAAAVYDVFFYNKPLIERIVTLSGDALVEPNNLLVRVGATFEDVIGQCGGIKPSCTEVEVLNGGPMMGISQSLLTVPVIKGTSGITVLGAEKIKKKPVEACIRCANCVDACPMGLMPYRLGELGIMARTDEFIDWSGGSCIECGCCSYVCPSQRPLLQWIRVGKLRVRQQPKE